MEIYSVNRKGAAEEDSPSVRTPCPWMPKAMSQQVKCRLGLLWQPSGYDSGLPVQGARVQSLVRELDATWKKKKSTGFLQELAESNMTREMASDQQSRSHVTECRVEYDKRNGL